MIVTVTPNPSLDLTYDFTRGPVGGPDDVQRAASATMEASGKGINVSRALAFADLDSYAVLPAGGATGRYLVELLDVESIRHRVTPQGGETRINTTALRPGGVTAKLNGPGATLAASEVDALRDAVDAALAEAAGARMRPWLAICGSLPPGVDAQLVVDLVGIGHRHKARCVVDASGPALFAALGAQADLIAPNRQELAEIDPSIPAVGDLNELADAAKRLASRVGIDLLVSLGRDGALHTDGSHALRCWGPTLVPVNTAGAGDALLSGWLSGEGLDCRARLERAVRWGRSACLTTTTVDPNPGRGDAAPLTIEELS